MSGAQTPGDGIFIVSLFPFCSDVFLLNFFSLSWKM